mmetsp:Transcript_40017/g.39618  ORF Transcript_40017/g.39618 Transcript_40017/m.39618 type:complete len:84 (+) Transcript_40017:26-277(+)
MKHNEDLSSVMETPSSSKKAKVKVRHIKTFRPRKDLNDKSVSSMIKNMKSFASFYKTDENKQKINFLELQKNAMIMSEINLNF